MALSTKESLKFFQFCTCVGWGDVWMSCPSATFCLREAERGGCDFVLHPPLPQSPDSPFQGLPQSVPSSPVCKVFFLTGAVFYERAGTLELWSADRLSLWGVWSMMWKGYWRNRRKATGFAFKSMLCIISGILIDKWIRHTRKTKIRIKQLEDRTNHAAVIGQKPFIFPKMFHASELIALPDFFSQLRVLQKKKFRWSQGERRSFCI